MSADDLAARVRRIEVMVSSAVDACDLTTRQRRAFRKIRVELGALAESFERAAPPPRTVFHRHLYDHTAPSEGIEPGGGWVTFEGLDDPGDLAAHPARGTAVERAAKLLPPLVLTPSEDRRPRRRR